MDSILQRMHSAPIGVKGDGTRHGPAYTANLQIPDGANYGFTGFQVKRVAPVDAVPEAVPPSAV